MIVVVGLSHHTAAIDVRERLALDERAVVELLQAVVGQPAIGEALVISTCNRVELVLASRREQPDLEQVAVEAQQALDTCAPGIAGHLYTHVGVPAVRHLFRVAASLDSMVLGEPQILGQVKRAYQLAQSAGTVGSSLHRVVHRAMRIAKRVRSETELGSGMVSVPSVAMDLARQIFGEIRGHTALLVGSGDMAEALARLLAQAGARLLVTGRNQAKTVELARAVGALPRDWRDLGAALVEADVVVTSTSAPGYVVDYRGVQHAQRERRGRSLFFIDLAVPRDVDPKVESFDGVYVYNIDDFAHIVEESVSSRKKHAERAEQLVAEEALGYHRSAGGSAQVTPAIVALREKFRQAMQAELEKSLRGRLKHLGPEDRAALDKMLEAALNKMLHDPSSRLRHAATSDAFSPDELVSVLEELFGLKLEEEGESSGEQGPADLEAGPGPIPARDVGVAGTGQR
ncbi:MAG TPA: glutamyl-tRNA reductase [Polyangiaceae bacterium]